MPAAELVQHHPTHTHISRCFFALLQSASPHSCLLQRFVSLLNPIFAPFPQLYLLYLCQREKSHLIQLSVFFRNFKGFYPYQSS
ncbi:hypothetical protein Aduo_010048 [Ancylostoma duodenale]